MTRRGREEGRKGTQNSACASRNKTQKLTDSSVAPHVVEWAYKLF